VLPNVSPPELHFLLRCGCLTQLFQAVKRNLLCKLIAGQNSGLLGETAGNRFNPFPAIAGIKANEFELVSIRNRTETGRDTCLGSERINLRNTRFSS
jgi:hypothetical protein